MSQRPPLIQPGMSSLTPTRRVFPQGRQTSQHKLLDRAALLAHIKQMKNDGGHKIYAFYPEELAGSIGSDYRAPMYRVNELLADLVTAGDLKNLDGVFVFQGRKTLTEAKINGQVKAANTRKRAAFTSFLDAIEARGESCSAAKNLNLLWESIRSGAENKRSDVGFRGVYLFLLEGKALRQAKYTSDRETSYKIPQEPTGIMKAVLEAPKALHRVELKPTLAETKEQFRAAGFSEVDELWIRSLLDNHIGSIDLLKLTNENGVPIGVLLLRDPVYFGKENQPRVDEKLTQFAVAIGNRIQEIWDERGVVDRLEDGRVRRELVIVDDVSPMPREILPIVPADTAKTIVEAPAVSAITVQTVPAPVIDELAMAMQAMVNPHQYHKDSIILPEGGFTTEYHHNPEADFYAVWPKVYADCNGVVADTTGSPMTKEELRAHVLQSSHLFIDRFGNEVTGFAATTDHRNYVNSRGKDGRLIYFAGIMVKKAYRGGRTAFLNLELTKRIMHGLSWWKLIRGKVPLVYRTQDDRIHSLGIRYYSAKKDSRMFTAEDWNAVRFVAKENNWQLENGSNICRKVYTRRMADTPEHLLPGLGETDGIICVGHITLGSYLRLRLDNFLFKHWPSLMKKKRK